MGSFDLKSADPEHIDDEKPKQAYKSLTLVCETDETTKVHLWGIATPFFLEGVSAQGSLLVSAVPFGPCPADFFRGRQIVSGFITCLPREGCET